MFGEHAAFIIPSYAISFLALSITAFVIWRTYALRKKELARIEAQLEKSDA